MSVSLPHEAEAHHHPELGFLRKYIFSEDHKIIGIQFLFSALIFFLIGGTLALLVRTQLGWPHATIPVIGEWLWPGSAGHRMSPDDYNMFFSMHASVMIFFVIIPVLAGGFGNFTIPLMIGARDMAFPKLNMLSYWFMWPAFVLILLSFTAFGGAAASGWTSYPTIAAVTMPAGQGFSSPAQAASGMGQVLWLTALIFIGVSSMMGSVNYITTIINMRAPGMTLFRMPMTIWGMFITAILQAFALPVLTVALFFQLMDKTINTTFFLPLGGLDFGNWTSGPGGGQPLLWQHLFWFYSHPAVYIMILPAMGMVSDIISTFARKPLFGYRPMVYSIAGIAGLGFIVWGHHMFQSGMDPRLGTGFMIATIMIALPSAVKTFNWLGTTWQGNLQFTTPMLNALAFVSMFIIGGLSGIFMAATPVDVAIHDTYFIVAHLHYVLFMSSIFGIFAGIYYWYPKMFGRVMSERWGKVHFILTFIFANCTFYPMHIIGAGLHMRRIYDPLQYPFLTHLQPLNQFMSISAMMLGLAQLVFFVNFIGSLFTGKRIGRNPWHSNTLEWSAPSPPPHGNFDKDPLVYRGPYEYAAPDQKEDYWPQTLPPGETPLRETEPVPAEPEAPADKPQAQPGVPAAPAKKPAMATAGRRSFLLGWLVVLFGSWFAIAWAAMGASLMGMLLGTVRFLFPNVLSEPPSKFKVGKPDQFEEGKVVERYKDQNAWIVRYQGKIYALSTTCTHLGCTPNWLESAAKFKCPCHGSGFYITGVNFEGPAPRPLERWGISLADDGQLIVDKSKKFQKELGQWDNTDSYFKT